jgi:hypothetical protein
MLEHAQLGGDRSSKVIFGKAQNASDATILGGLAATVAREQFWACGRPLENYRLLPLGRVVGNLYK